MRIKIVATVLSILSFTLFAAASSPSVTQLGQFTGTDILSNQFFGNSVISQDGSTVAIGASGNAGEIYVYQKPVGGWGTMSQTARLYPSAQCYLGEIMAISADGSTIASFSGDCSGGGFLGYGWIQVFVRPAGGWQDTNQPTAILALKKSGSYNFVGLSLGITAEGKTIATTGYFPYSHKAYLFLFDKSSGGWTNMGPTFGQMLSASATNPEDVAISGQTIAVTNGGDNTVHVFRRSAGAIKQLATLSASDGGLCCYLWTRKT